MTRWRAHARRRSWWVLLAIALISMGTPAAAQVGSDSIPAAPDSAAVPPAVGFVNDHAGVIAEPMRARLEAFLDQLRRKTGVEFAILVVRTTAPEAPTEYKVRVFQRWGIGRRGQDEGLLLLVAMTEREIWFETGYGLEGTLPDGLQARIVRERMVPKFRAGDPAGGIVDGVLAIAARIAAEKGVTMEWDGRALRYDAPSRRLSPVVVVIGVVFIVILVAMIVTAHQLNQRSPRARRRRRRSGWDDFGGWGGGGGGWGGGGFGGGGWGGGGFGGGGGSFGGFGGGASGGGGGGGKW
jgi:uncharacterized protein